MNRFINIIYGAGQVMTRHEPLQDKKHYRMMYTPEVRIAKFNETMRKVEEKINRAEEEGHKIGEKGSKKYIPIIIEKGGNDNTIPDKINEIVMINENTEVAALYILIKQKLAIESHKSIYLMVDNQPIDLASKVGDVYQEKKFTDGFLYVNYYVANTFG